MGTEIRLRLLGSSRTITRVSRAGYRARMLFHFGGWKRRYTISRAAARAVTDLEHNRGFRSGIDEAGASGKSFL